MQLHLRNRDPKNLLFSSEPAPARRQDPVTDADIPFEHEVGAGQSHKITLDGLSIHHGWHRVDRDVVLQGEEDSSSVELHVSLKGGVAAQVEGLREPVRVRPGTQLIWYAPAPRFRFALAAGVHYERFEVNLTTAYFASLAERYPELLEASFRQVERRTPFCLQPDGCITTPQMKHVMHQILRSEEQGVLRRMFIEAKVMELLALHLQQHEQRNALAPGAAALSKRDIDRMVEARDRVLARMDDPPTLPELAHQVGTNEFVLKRDFKAVFGTTVYGLLLDYKLEHARTQLLDTDRPIGEIAGEVGYSHPSHFSTAFKKKYGVSPSAMRRW